MSPNEQSVLLVLAEHTAPMGEMCRSFDGIRCGAREIGAELERPAIRRCCRSLARKGLAEFHKGLWTDQGEPRGAGYCISLKGRQTAEALKAERAVERDCGFSEARLGS